jgi:hypothetical protein
MTPAAKLKAAKYGLYLSILGLLTGAMMLCDCPGWFACAGIAAFFPTFFGTRVLRVAGICLCIVSFGFSAIQFQHERERAERIRRVQEKGRQIDSQL